MKHKIIIIFLLFASLINAQEEKKSYSLSLQEAIEHALQNNYTAINASKDIEIAKKKKWETTTIGLPQLNANINYQNNFVLQKSVVPAEFFGGNPGEFAEVEFGTKHNMTANATLSQLIFDGSYLVGLQSAKVYLEISQNAKEKTDLEIRSIVINSYGNVLLARESAKVLNENKISLEKTLFETNETYKNGLVEEENVEQLQITLSQVNSSLSNANRRAEIALNMLKLVLGIDIQEDLQLTDNLDNLATKNIDLSVLGSDFNVNNTIDYKIGQNKEESNRLLLKLEKSKALPSLSANVNFGYNAFGNEFQFFNQDQKWFNYSNLGVALNIPIFSSLGRTAKTQQAKIAYEQAKTELKETEQTLLLEYQNTKSDYEYSIEQYSFSKENLRLSERIEKKQQVKFKEGLSSSFEYTEAQRQLYSAQQTYLQAMIDVINKKTALDKITNNK
ncbi:transporter [Flavobacterium sp. 316]|uniref:TolC family protein n=1 Tax=Flavobacterium sediminilitoris TaxID=2024526 RepID=A0ABY4HUE0_9FLAO|nr:MULTISPECIES: TolC family protein [Flavobacterium]KIX21087.1 transporter [Flavobacterium sp. 316]UOX35184.1 TolC family protein [Flavobacterium sediminilitoris]